MTSEVPKTLTSLMSGNSEAQNEVRYDDGTCLIGDSYSFTGSLTFSKELFTFDMKYVTSVSVKESCLLVDCNAFGEQFAGHIKEDKGWNTTYACSLGTDDVCRCSMTSPRVGSASWDSKGPTCVQGNSMVMGIGPGGDYIYSVRADNGKDRMPVDASPPVVLGPTPPLIP
jgi:hypothetical protein